MTVPIWIVPGQAPDCVVALLGSGRRHVGTVGDNAGFDFYPLTGRNDPPSLEKVAGAVELASTDHHNLIFDMAGDIVRHGTLVAIRQGAALSRWRRAGAAPLSLEARRAGSLGDERRS